MTAFESPFLDKEAFAGERGDETSSRSAALAATHPFAQAFEQVDEWRDQEQLERVEEAPFFAGDEFGEHEDEGLDEEATLPWLEAAEDEDEVAPWAAAIDPFPPAPSIAFVRDDARMTAAFAPVKAGSAKHLCSAVVDLTGDPAMPPYAGLNDDEMLFVGSLPKICAMVAAFALKARVQAFVDAAAANGAPVTAPAITRAIDNAWKPKLKALFPDRPTTSFGNNQDIALPKLDRIFTFSPSGKVEFARAAPALTDADLDQPAGRTSAEFKSPPGRFHDWMRLMLRWSNNTAASRCILALGYHYINGALARAGLFDAVTQKGLWLSADYAGHDWVKTQAARLINAAGPPLAARWATPQRRQRSNATATAAQIARLMTLLAQDKLANATASQDMRALMTITPGGIGSYARGALVRVGRTPDTIAAKIGYGDDAFSHDCAIVERTVAGKALRYVAVGLGSAPARKREDLRELFVCLDDTIVTRNAPAGP
jgi:Beta-lactamase enzyme family